ncbi:MAG TPA: hypothetical protein VEF04_14420, partial [Blastocatellia bacterium]|nr:hypothetical protein [Blastocatellia bacterium]
MSEIRVEVDTRGLEQLAKNFEQVGKVAMLRLLEAGEELIREEAPERTGRLKGKRSAGGSVNSELIKLPNGYRGEINVSAIRERTNATSATAVSAKGTKKQIKLRAQNAFD